MRLEDIKELFELCTKHNVLLLKYSDSDMKIMVEKFVDKNEEKEIVERRQLESALKHSKQQSDDKNYEAEYNTSENIIIKSQYVGIIDFSVELDDAAGAYYVEKGTTLCTIEAMKLFNEVKAPVAGFVKKLVLNKSQVEFGQALFEIRVEKDV